MADRTLRSGQCPACDSTEVYCDRNFKKGDRVILKLTLWSARTAPVETYVCASCGYIERYLRSGAEIYTHLDYIKTNWWRVEDKEKRKRDHT